MSEDKFYVGSVDSSPTSSVQNLERLFQGSSLTSTLQHNSASDLGSLGGRGMKKARENRSYLWGPTGEQEWSPDMTTGSHVYLYMPTTLFLDCLAMYMYPLHILPVTCLGGML